MQIIPADRNTNQLYGDDYKGMASFCFWRYGEWTNVIVDDRIPVDGYGRPMFAHSTDPHEIWPCLIEKAYAKYVHKASLEPVYGVL